MKSGIHSSLSLEAVEQCKDILTVGTLSCATNHDIAEHFRKECGEADTPQTQILLFVSDVIEMAMNPDDGRKPFSPCCFWNGKRSLDISDIDDNQVQIMKQVGDVTAIPLLKAILNDVAWECARGDIANAQTAVRNYCATIQAVNQNNQTELGQFLPFLKRALMLVRIFKFVR